VGLLEKDSFHIGFSQPLRVEQGKATIMAPQLYNQNGTMNYSNISTDLTPSGRQLDLTFGYKATIDKGINTGIQMALSQDYGHVQSNNITTTATAYIKFVF
jgi:hypothetical protein